MLKHENQISIMWVKLASRKASNAYLCTFSSISCTLLCDEWILWLDLLI